MGRILTTDGFNLSLYLEGEGSGTVPARVGVDLKWDLITIPHGFESDELIWQVGIVAGGSIYSAPFIANGGFEVASYLDDTNLYIVVADTSVVNEPAFDFDYIYRLLLPSVPVPVAAGSRATSSGDTRVTSGGDIRVTV